MLFFLVSSYNGYSVDLLVVDMPPGIGTPSQIADVVVCDGGLQMECIQWSGKAISKIMDIIAPFEPGKKIFILEGIYNKDWKYKLEKILRQTKFIQPHKKYISRSSILSKSYLVIGTK